MKDHVILKLEVESMKASMLSAINQRNLDLNGQINDACERFLKSGQIQSIVDSQLQAVINEEIKAFFQWGDGRKLITSMVQNLMSEKIKEWKNSDCEG